MTERRLSELLRERPLPGEAGAEERAWRVVSAAAAERRPARRQRPFLRLAATAAALVIVAALASTPPGSAVADWVGDTMNLGRNDARPALSSLPAPGRLLVISAQGPWIVERDGSKRRLGAYEQAGWSPNGLFVVAARGGQLVALDPKGSVRWSLARSRRVRGATWSPDGFRIAYLSGRSLRVVAGDGTADHLLSRRVAPTAPAWRAGAKPAVAFSDRSGRVSLVDPDRGRRIWRSSPGPVPRHLAWTADGTRLVALATTSLRVLAGDGRLVSEISLGPDARARALAVHPGGKSAAVGLRDRDGRSKVVSFPLRTKRAEAHRLFAGHGRFTDLGWSPDGRWLLVAWREADQWLFVRSTRVQEVDAVSNIARQFDPAGQGRAPFPRLGGWCCQP